MKMTDEEKEMSHEIEMVNGQAQMAWVDAGEGTPWHNLGVRVDEGISPAEMMKVSGLDWTVEKRPMYLADGAQVPKKHALVRTSDNKVLDLVGNNWTPVQNSTAFDFFQEFCDAGDMTMHTAGSLLEGRRIWALAKVASDFTVFGDDKVEGYLLFSNPHMFGQCVDVRFTPIRVVCNNTLTMSLNSKAQNFAKVNHRGEFDPEAVKEILGIARNTMEEYKQVAEFLGSKQVEDKKFKEFLGKVFGESSKDGKLRRNAQLAYEVFETQPGAEFARGSWWQALNAVTYITDHQMGRTNDARLNSVWFGAGRKQKINAVKEAVSFAEAA